MIEINSEIGKLKKVLLHRPNGELENLIPEYLVKLLFDDIPYLEIAQREHDVFASVLKENGAEVLYIEDLFSDILNETDVVQKFLDQFFEESGVTSEGLKESLKEFFLSMSPKDMVLKFMSGVRKDEIEVKRYYTLAGIIEDDYPFYIDPMPNLYFTRDPAACIGKGLTINRMATAARRRESLFIEYIYEYHPMFKKDKPEIWYDRSIPFSIEGGDELVLNDKIVAIGCSERTTPQAIEITARNLFKASAFEKVLVFEIPKSRAFMHLDTVFTMVDYDKFTIHPGVEGPLSIYEISKGAGDDINIEHKAMPLNDILKESLGLSSVQLIKCGDGDKIASGREQWNDGSNTLAIAPGVVVTYDRNYITNRALRENGIKVITIPSSELSRGRGGPRCMSMPLLRESVSW
ncbi:MAG: arginine deiminase [Thermoanaerobacteraceae bacterium]|nr:arginine deiminase [Thermoanaerobacteraceae bacterium]